MLQYRTIAINENLPEWQQTAAFKLGYIVCHHPQYETFFHVQHVILEYMHGERDKYLCRASHVLSVQS